MVAATPLIAATPLVAVPALAGTASAPARMAPASIAPASMAPGSTAIGDHGFYFPNNLLPTSFQTYFISHRGVHLRQRVAGENSIESLRLAKRVGFQSVEFDVRLTKDGKNVVIHDDTINRTLRRLDGSRIEQPIKVSHLTLAEIRNDYRIYSDNPKARSIVPTFEEYVHACNRYQVIPFVELKNAGRSPEQYRELIGLLDRVIGRQNYIITSNNQVSDEIRALGYQDIMLMGILYQTTFERIQNWGHTFMAISATRFTPEQFAANVQLSNLHGLITESHADTMDKYNLQIQNGIDYISTDLLQPTNTGYGQVLDIHDLDNGKLAGLLEKDKLRHGVIQLGAGERIRIDLDQYQDLFLYGVELELLIKGKFECSVQGKAQEFERDGRLSLRHPLLLHKETYQLTLTAVEPCEIKGLRLSITKY